MLYLSCLHVCSVCMPACLFADCCSPFLACRRLECPKNHIEHFTVQQEAEDGQVAATERATVSWAHHKNEHKDGMVVHPVNQPLVEVLKLLEQASHHLQPGSASMWFNLSGEAYSREYWSQICTAALSYGGQHITGRLAAVVHDSRYSTPALGSH